MALNLEISKTTVIDEHPRTESQTSTSLTEYKVYPTRWYILAMFALCGVWQNLVYGTFGPITDSATKVLQLTQTDLALLPNWYNIAFLISAFPYVWLVEVKGLRMPMTATMGFCAIGAAVRCLHTGDLNFDKAFLHLGQLINGFGAAVPWFACTTVSAVWFPPQQRNLATAIGLFASGLGVSFAFMLGPAFIDAFKGSGSDEEIYDAIYKLFYFEALVSNGLLFLTVFYFPSKPPTPPSFSASTARVQYVTGFRQFFVNPQGWIMFLVYSLNTITGSWNQFIGLLLEEVMSEQEIGWLGATMTSVSVIFGPILATLASLPTVEKYSRHISIVLVILACCCFGLFVTAANIESQRYLLTPTLIWATFVPGLTLATAAQPIWWELACDAVYPVPESVVSGIFSFGSCSLSVVFLVILMFPQLGFIWINWVLIASQLTMVPLLIIYRHNGKRTFADKSGRSDSSFSTEEVGDGGLSYSRLTVN